MGDSGVSVPQSTSHVEVLGHHSGAYWRVRRRCCGALDYLTRGSIKSAAARCVKCGYGNSRSEWRLPGQDRYWFGSKGKR